MRAQLLWRCYRILPLLHHLSLSSRSLNDYRTSTAPERAENLILSSAIFKSKIVSKALLVSPETGVEDNNVDLDKLFEARAARLDAETFEAEDDNGDCTTDLNGLAVASDLDGDLDS